MALRRHPRSTAWRPPVTRASTSSISRRTAATQPRRARRCSGRWRARSPALPAAPHRWIDATASTAPGTDRTRSPRALADTPRLGLPGSDFIFPTVHQVDRAGTPATSIAPTLPADVADGGARDDSRSRPGRCSRTTRVRAVRMDALPHAAAGGARHPALARRTRRRDRDRGDLRRGAFAPRWARATIDLDDVPERVAVAGARRAREPIPRPRRARCSTRPTHELAALVPELAARGGAHEDAHLAKYTLACSRRRPRSIPRTRRLYLAAAAYLHAWWAQTRIVEALAVLVQYACTIH